MVKSFQGVRKAHSKEIQNVTVSEYMTVRLTTFKPSQTVGEVAAVLISKKLSGGPVTDENGKLVGIISEGDCLKQMVRGKYNNSPNNSGTVADHMVHDVITVSPEMNVLDAADKFLHARVRRFPVVRNGELLGQISQRDVLRAVQSLKNETWGDV